MADAPMSRDVEDFFINPTMVPTDGQSSSTSPRNRNFSRPATMDIPTGTLAMLLEKEHKKTQDPTAVIRHLSAELQTNVPGPQTYTSDEEVASPVDANDFSSCPSDSEVCEAVETSIPEQLATSCNNVEQRLRKAQAVQMVKAPKPKMISMAKSAEHTTNEVRMKRPAPSTTSASTSRATSFQSSRQASMAPVANARLSRQSANSSATEFDQPQPVPIRYGARQPSMPLLAAVGRDFDHAYPTFPVSNTPQHAPRSSSMRQPRSTPRNDANPPPAADGDESWPLRSTAAPPPNRLNKVASTLSLHKFGRKKTLAKRHRSTANSSSSVTSSSSNADIDEDDVYTAGDDFEIPPRSKNLMQHHFHTRSRMVPRGANERAPAIKLPPCPDQGSYVYQSYAAPAASCSVADFRAAAPRFTGYGAADVDSRAGSALGIHQQLPPTAAVQG
ncbi:hypothetical protein K431DRAFT_285112 [Polychaeton citri CBS 116435]|uniref:Uncharacterized protein n=1 Tax=Polychaeton citri CBS 116435 TaxID=1314669 RepID=A0A9P4UNU5_9PEZI|nr:hypothetical protein K431DRAFT_285112 [Polychaeton citri CBS 116435]